MAVAVFLAFAKNRGARSVVRSQDSDETVGVLCQKDQLGTANVKKKKRKQVAYFLGQTVIGMFWSGCTEEEEE